MITEQYVTFETARLLKEAGFEAECSFIIDDDGRKLYRPSQHFAPLWLWLTLVGIAFFAFLLLCAYEPKPKPKYWFSIIEYLDEAGHLCKQPYIKKGYDKPFFDEEELKLIDRIVRFHFTEIDESTYLSIKDKINQQEQNEEVKQ